MSLDLGLKTLRQLKQRAVWASDVGEYWFCACKILHAQSFGSEPTPEMDEGRAIHEAVSEADMMTMIRRGMRSKPVEVKTIEQQIELNVHNLSLIRDGVVLPDNRRDRLMFVIPELREQVSGKKVFIIGQENIHAQTVIGQNFGDIIQPAGSKIDQIWNLARNFTLKGGDQEWKPFRIDLIEGQAVKGYFDAEDDVFAYILTPTSLKSFERGDGFNSLWDASQEDYAEVDFVPEKSGTYYFVVSNFDPEEDEVCYDEDDNVSVELRLRY